MELALLCRPGFEGTLAEEIRARRPELPPGALTESEGLVMAAIGLAPPPPAFVFERQRMVDPVAIPATAHKPAARGLLKSVFAPILHSPGGWTVHVFAPESSEPSGLQRRARTFEQVLLDMVRERFTVAWRRYSGPGRTGGPAADQVLQVCVTADRLLAGVMPLSALSSPRPGGVHRMADDPLAPSRSFLKIEEAFDLMGEQPRARQSVIDLGAAPGGWSYAFLKRGCEVTAVDRGPMRIPERAAASGALRHVREDGITFEPEPGIIPVDWLVSDMLQAAGTNIGMLRKWLDNRWMRRFVINIKLPQVNPWPAIPPLEQVLASVPRAEWRLRQLYHDRREVTLYGRLAGG